MDQSATDSGPLKAPLVATLPGNPISFLARWEFAALFLAIVGATVLVYQLPRSWQVDIGGPYDGPWLSGFHEREGDATFNWRWTTSQARVNLPGLGAGWYDLNIYMAAGGADRQLPTVSIWINGKPKADFTVEPNYRAYRIALAPNDFLAGDLEITIRSHTFVPAKDPRSLGVAIDAIRVEPARTLGRLPAFGTLVFALLAAMVCTTALSMAGIGLPVTLAFLLLLTALYSLGLAVNRVEVATFLPRFLTACLLSVPIPFAVVRLLDNSSSTSREGKGGGPQLEHSVPSPGYKEQKTWVQGVAAVALLASLAKIGGTLYPQIVVIDLPFHVAQIRQVLAGNFWKLYLPGPLSLAVMPEKEWTVRAPIPYSPFFYLFMSPLAWLPVDIRLTVPLVNAVLEAWKLPLVILLGLRLGLTKLEAGMGGVVYGLAAAMYMLLQWGNWPTTFSQWFALAGLALILKAHRRSTLLLSCLLLTVAFISYTVTAVFLLTMLVVIVGTFLIFRPPQPDRRQLVRASVVLLVAWLVAFVGYYSTHLYVALTQTLPAFAGALATQGTLSTRTGTLSQYLVSNLTSLSNYGLMPIVMAGLWAVGATWSRWGGYQRAVVVAWIGVLLLFTVVGFKVDMVLKHVWFAVPLLAALSGAMLVNIGRRGRSGFLLSAACLGVLAWATIWLWTWRIWEASH